MDIEVEILNSNMELTINIYIGPRSQRLNKIALDTFGNAIAIALYKKRPICQ